MLALVLAAMMVLSGAQIAFAELSCREIYERCLSFPDEKNQQRHEELCAQNFKHAQATGAWIRNSGKVRFVPCLP